MADIPDGADKTVAAMAIAWELTKKAFGSTKFPTEQEQGADRLLEVYEKAFRKIHELAYDPL